MTTPQPFALARRLRAGEMVFSAWCTLASPVVAETIARDGYPCVVLDIQHGLWDTASTIAGIAGIASAGSAPVVRVPVADFAFVSRALDVGAEAIIAPMINTPADARQFAAAAKYPPLGERSWGPQRAMAMQGLSVAADYLRDANTGTLTLAMIETETALANVDAIAATPGIDALFVGPYDLSTALSGGRAQDMEAPDVERAIDRIGQAAIKAGKIPGIYCRDANGALAMAQRGFRFLTIGSDLGLVRDGVAAQLQALKA
ncbi:MAG: aldolase/citrate lyase family protein [Pseudolabrys sp.]|nr:aldolase/citrate lyase family protein [Pseudolabrys sp.]